MAGFARCREDCAVVLFEEHDPIGDVTRVPKLALDPKMGAEERCCELGDQLLSSPQPSATYRQATPERVLQPLTYLEPAHELVQGLGISPKTAQAFGAGYAPKGIMRGKIGAFVIDSVSPVICTVCELISEMEPDQTRGWCESCGTNTVVAAPILAGII